MRSPFKEEKTLYLTKTFFLLKSLSRKSNDRNTASFPGIREGKIAQKLSLRMILLENRFQLVG